MQIILFAEKQRQLALLENYVSTLNTKLEVEYNSVIVSGVLQIYKDQQFSLSERPDLFDNPLIIFFGDLYDEVQIGRTIGEVLVFTEDVYKFNTLDAIVVKSIEDATVFRSIERAIRSKLKCMKIN